MDQTPGFAGRTDVFDSAVDEAVRRGQEHVGIQHLLLAIADPQRVRTDSVAFEAITQADVDYASIDRVFGGVNIADVPDDADEPSARKLTVSGSVYGCLGFAQGIAKWTGADRVTEIHVLLALCHGLWGFQTHPLVMLGSSPQAVVNIIRAAGVSTPETDAPNDRFEVGLRVLDPARDRERVVPAVTSAFPLSNSKRFGDSPRMSPRTGLQVRVVLISSVWCETP